MAERSIPDYPLELSGDSYRALIAKVTDRLVRFLDALPHQATPKIAPSEELLRAVVEPLPERGRPSDEILDQLFHDIFPSAFNTTGPGYLAYIPGGGLPESAVADWIALTANRYVGMAAAAPVVAQVEATVIRWLSDLVGLPPTAGGYLTSGGSLANWAALVTVRESKIPEDFRVGVIYTSNQAHHSVIKAATLAGFAQRNVRRVEVDRSYRVSIEHLRRLLAEDRRQGLRPVAIIAQAGTTNTGAVDDLVSLAELAAAECLWLHVDAAYGGFFLLVERGREAMRGIERADSVTLDPHKGLFLPYGTGCLLVRQKADLRRTFAGRGEYMPIGSEGGVEDFCDISPELSRDFRGLRIWLPLQLHGAAPFRQSLQEKLELADYATQQLKQIEGLDIVAEPQLSIVAFRLVVHGQGDERLNQLNRELLAYINRDGRVFLSSTMLEGRVVLRLCILSFRTHRDRINECLQRVREGVRILH